jgi:[acyl-carrier-protein] S-malonyltransferase
VTVAWIFPGQGAQRLGMAVDLATNHPGAAAVFAEASEAAGIDLLDLCRTGRPERPWERASREERLRDTELTQPALLTASVACMAASRASLPPPDVVAGHSLGEYSALVAAGTLTLTDAVRLVRHRGRLMAAATAGQDVAMAAILGLEPDVVAGLCQRCTGPRLVVPSAYNARRQVVVGGHRDAVEAVAAAADRMGGQARILQVSSAFHTPLMTPVVRELAVVIDAAPFAPPGCPVVPNTTARATVAPGELRRQLVRQVDRPVCWTDTHAELHRLGVDTVIELGPGRVLSALARKADRRLQVLAVEDEPSLRAARDAIAGSAPPLTGVAP